MWGKRVGIFCLSALLYSNFFAYAVDEIHWAESTLLRAVDMGLLHGDVDGGLYPDSPLEGAQLAAILSRVLMPNPGGDVYPGTIGVEWYAPEASALLALGILPVDGSLPMEAPASRGQTFVALAAAFQLKSTDTSLNEINRFTDADTLNDNERKAAAALLQAGVLKGDDGKLNVKAPITRAEFVTLLYRLTDGPFSSFSSPGRRPVIFDTSVVLEGNTFPDGMILAPPVQHVTMDNVRCIGELLVRSTAENLVFSDVCGDTLVLAPKDKLAVSGTDDSTFHSVVIGDGMGQISVDGLLCSSIEIESQGRDIELKNLTLDKLVVRGSNNRILLQENVAINNLSVVQEAMDNNITANGTCENVALWGHRTSLSGAGSANQIEATGKGCVINLNSAIIDHTEDLGLDGLSIQLDAPAVKPGANLQAIGRFTGMAEPKECAAQWYLDGKPLPEYTIEKLNVSEDSDPFFDYPLEFAPKMPLFHIVGLEILYKNPITGESERQYTECEIEIENYPLIYYADAVLDKVSPHYSKGAQDYSTEEKELYVNAKGYDSKTSYLIWINRGIQRVNVFEGQKEDWKLIHAFSCATGKSSTPTPLGITYVTGKQKGWFESTYSCYPVVRFYPGTGYAMHSRLYEPAPNTKKLQDGRMGQPVSHGCVRMMDDGIQWIYNNIPIGTAVVIY